MTPQTHVLLQRRLELDKALTMARREANEAQAKLTLARRRVKAAEKAYYVASDTYFAAVEAERGVAP
jgi:hypothetical protein